jgi:hypothetical protein
MQLVGMGSARALACGVPRPRGHTGACTTQPFGVSLRLEATGEGAARNTRGRVCSPKINCMDPTEWLIGSNDLRPQSQDCGLLLNFYENAPHVCGFGKIQVAD